MRTTLIITTYNWKEALEVCLLSAVSQVRLPDEIIVADDGSREDTAEVVQSMSVEAPVPIIHSWQADRGFRLARSRNRAIARASGEYIILVDGDIVLHERFIEDHCRFAEAAHFAQGARVLLGPSISVKVLKLGKHAVSIFASELGNRKNCLRSRILSSMLSYRTRSLHGIKTCNFAFWRDDAVRVNGFNEEFVGWGREDSEFTARLMNRGVLRRNIRFSAVAYHLFHAMNTRERLQQNDAILHRTIQDRATWCSRGLDQHLSCAL